ncbi:indole-3-glycerol phosphate synthase TrpC [Gynuella sunshinyii]|uniref:Indole-3-glycerol phosphate synthase n=1 Tax=Gynuella sunshinyii YC6258 TaxID=1445510 RepID=A0A0C5W129_9GAMM|nr:indole-3-glycerol phosphate synthase TrpC [Gynuella sunshinyii]AJQ96399.1 indole-3-glycerol phosphate synthase [Gynuella sunshinyii YC6258]
MTEIPTILKKIIDKKWQEIEERQETISIKQLEERFSNVESPRGFVRAIEKSIAQGRSAVIAEIKKASPSKGILRESFDPEQIAISYEQAGATCLSVLTDKDFFMGGNDYLREARAVTKLPVIRKDFIVDPYQVYESRALGADCILLIVAVLDDESLVNLNSLAHELGMDVLVEVHDQQELTRALPLNNRLIGINNRNLHTFDVSLDTTHQLLGSLPQDVIVVTESGIHTHQDVAAMRAHHVNSFLVGEAFMKADNPGEKLSELFSLGEQ